LSEGGCYDASRAELLLLLLLLQPSHNIIEFRCRICVSTVVLLTRLPHASAAKMAAARELLTSEKHIFISKSSQN
jgi:hypothetical protein